MGVEKFVSVNILEKLLLYISYDCSFVASFKGILSIYINLLNICHSIFSDVLHSVYV